MAMLLLLRTGLRRAPTTEVPGGRSARQFTDDKRDAAFGRASQEQADQQRSWWWRCSRPHAVSGGGGSQKEKARASDAEKPSGQVASAGASTQRPAGAGSGSSM